MMANYLIFSNYKILRTREKLPIQRNKINLYTAVTKLWPRQQVLTAHFCFFFLIHHGLLSHFFELQDIANTEKIADPKQQNQPLSCGCKTMASKAGAHRSFLLLFP
jgi:hypothetical protein